MRIAIVGDGNVGSALQRGLRKGGHDVQASGHEPERVRDIASTADVIILAVPFGALGDVVGELGDTADGKVIVDSTNVLTPDYELAIGFTTSGAEELQKKMPSASVLKAFNTVFAANMDTGHVNGEPLAAFVAGDSEDAKRTVLALASS